MYPRQSSLVAVMVKAATKAARSLLRDFNEVEQLQVSKKGPADFVSAADIKAESIIKESLEKSRPDYGFIGEESGETRGANRFQKWIVDPLDGTTNFLHGLPHWAISIALVDDDVLTAGVVFDPVKDEMFWAERGKGAFINDRRLRVSARRDLTQSVLATGFPFAGKKGHGDTQRDLIKLMPRTAGIRRFGAAALDLAYVAAGRYDGFWERGLQPWDIAAGILIVQESGGLVADLDGGSEMLAKGTVLATNAELHTPVGKLLNEARDGGAGA